MGSGEWWGRWRWPANGAWRVLGAGCCVVGPAGERQQTIHGPRQGGPKKHFTGPAGEGPKQSTGQAPQKLYADTGQNKEIGNATLKRKNIKVETKIPSGDHPRR